MKSKIFFSAITLALVFLGLDFGSAQSPNPVQSITYSESVSYEPLAEKIPEGKGKKKKNDKTEPQAEAKIPVLVKTSTISLPLAVFNSSGQFVSDISVKDLEVFVDDEKVEIAELRNAEAPAEIVLLVDTSPSVLYTLDEIRKVLDLMIAQLRDTDRVTIAGFDGSFRVILNSSTDRNAMKKAIGKLKFESGTSLYEAVDRVTFELSAAHDSDGKRVFVITDGVDTTSQKSSLGRSLINTARSNAVYFPIYVDSFPANQKATKNTARIIANIPGLGPAFNSQPIRAEDFALGREYLTSLFNLTGGIAFIFPANETDANSTAKKAALAARSRYSIIIDRAKLSASDEPKRLRVRINRPGLSVLTKSSFVAGP